MSIGINSLSCGTYEIKKIDISQVEVCLSRDGTDDEKTSRALEMIEKLSKEGMKTSIHLPIFLFDWFEYDFFSAFFISKDIEKREKSFRFLEENLKKLNSYHYEIEYLVLHFPGINHLDDNNKDFDKLINESLKRVNHLAIKYEFKILLEYFGTNILFADYSMWIEKIKKYSNLEILVDTGHLYFASLINKFDFEEAFNVLSKEAFAFHFWTIKSGGFYKQNKSYSKYHHIIPNINQKKSNGWAFNTKEIYSQMIDTKKPIILEAANLYNDNSYYYDSIKGLVKYKKHTKKQK